MLGENIRTVRTRKGYSQETLAQQLNVVRQTVSKWEKGLSVPDAEMLAKLAELLEVPVCDLLGSEPPEEEKRLNDIALQLAILNEQLAKQQRMRRRTRKILLGVIVGAMLLCVLYVALLVGYRAVTETRPEHCTTAEIRCELHDESYLYGVTYDDQFRILFAGGDAFIADHVNTEQYSDANILMAQIEDYFLLRGGSCEIEYTQGIPES